MCTVTTHPMNDTPTARRLRFLVLGSIPLSAALAGLSLFLPLSNPSFSCISSILFMALGSQIVQAVHLLVTRSVVGTVSIVSAASTATMIGLELGTFILTVLCVYDYEPEFDPYTYDDYDTDYDTEYDDAASWSSQFVIPFVVLLWVQLLVMCTTFAHMVSIRRKAALSGNYGTQLLTLRNLAIACALSSWLVFILSMVGDFGLTSFFIFPVTSGLCVFYYTVALILHRRRPSPRLFTSRWAATFAFIIGLAETTFFCFWLAIVIVEIEYQLDDYVDDWFPYATPGILIALAIFVSLKAFTLMCLALGGLVPQQETADDDATDDDCKRGSQDLEKGQRVPLKRGDSVASEAEYHGK